MLPFDVTAVPWARAAFAWVYTSCCILVLAWQQLSNSGALARLSYARAAGLARREVLAEIGRGDGLAIDPRVNGYITALLIAGAAELASAREGAVCEPSMQLRGWGGELPLRAFGGGASALGWLYAAWRDGGGASRRVRAACLLASLLLVGSFLDSAGPTSAGAMPAGDCFRWLAGCALAAHCASAVLARAAGWAGEAADADVRRLLLHAAGSLLLLGSAALAHAVPIAAADLCVGAEHLATAAFTASAWLLAHPPATAPTDDAQGRAAGRAARRAPQTPPLLLDANGGGVQGMASFWAGLIQDTEGDTAHEFWEALADGAFRLILGGGGERGAGAATK